MWAMPSRWTFTIEPIAKLLREELTEGLWIDPFGGENSPAQITNDLNPERPTTHHIDALEFLNTFEDNSVDGVLFDPPYSISKAVQCYNSYGKDKLEINVASMAYWSSCKNQMMRIIKVGGKAICFGWSSNGVGKKGDLR